MRTRSWIALLGMAWVCANASGEQPSAPVHVNQNGGARRVRVGETKLLTWTVTGTTKPMPVRLSNQRPDIGSLEGGDEQTAMSSGGKRNTVKKSFTGLAP